MEERLHPEVDRNTIQEQYNKMLNYKFPQPPEDDELYDLFAELVEIDEYIMGLVSSYLKTGEIDVEKLKCDSDFLLMQNKILESSSEIKEICKYKEELDELISLFVK